jgi:cation transport regulator ChaB
VRGGQRAFGIIPLSRGGKRREEAAFRIAWAAVKREYMKVGDQWERQR